ncbi:O-antigen ligase family protein [Variovorax sp. V118]|uniref:O-antigen ligase family protein n=1 Tax=Variovorax sp. V118 TaxID=3065954 RepID=UPI0034E87273
MAIKNNSAQVLRASAAVGLAAVVYLLFVAGGVIPYAEGDEVKGWIKALLLMAVIFLFRTGRVDRSSVLIVGAFLGVGLVLGVLELFRSRNFGFALEKIDGAILASAFIALLINKGCERNGRNSFYSAFLLWSFFVLLLTVFYKLYFGFFEREVRFFLNGPIVYGWILGLCGLLSFDQWRIKGGLKYLVFFAAFFVGLLWTESKGSVIAFLVGWAFYLIFTVRRNFGVILLGFVLCVGSYLLFSEFFDEVLSNSRFAALERLFTSNLTAVDEGSVGARSVLLEEALRGFWENPLFGIGLGGFSYGEYVYPHNQHLEILAELGIFVALLHFAFVLFSFIRSDLIYRTLIIFFATAASFSGDSSYLRFLYAFCLLGLIWRERIGLVQR